MHHLLIRRPLPGLVVAIVLSFALPADAGKLPRAFERAPYKLEIQQRGKTVSIKKNRATLARRTFDLVLTLPKGSGVLVNVSTSPVQFKRALSGKSLAGGPPLGPGSGMAERNGNPSQELWISARGSHYLYCQNAKTHRFSSVKLRGDSVVGRRRVAAILNIDKRGPRVPLPRFKGKDLYLVLYARQYRAGGSKERWRKVVHIRFP